MEPFGQVLTFFDKLLTTFLETSNTPSHETLQIVRATAEALTWLQNNNYLVVGLHRLQQQTQQTARSSLSDITIKVAGKLFHAHRCVLAAVSPYFEAMFASGYQESSKKEIEIKDIDDTVFELLLNFVYTGRMDLSLDSVIDVLHAAVYLQLPLAEMACGNFLSKAIKEEKVPPEDVLSILVVSEDYAMSNLTKKCYKYLTKTDVFLEVIATSTFLEKAPSELIDRFLKRIDMPQETNETQLFEGIVFWLKHDWKNRKEHARHFLPKFRLGLIPKDKVKELMDAEILELPECQEILDVLMQNWKKFGGKDDVTQLPESFLPRNLMKTLLSIGGPDPPLVTFFNRHTHNWDPLDEFPEIPCQFPPPPLDPEARQPDIRYHAALVVNGDIYVAGGDVDDEPTEDDNRFLKFDGQSYTWQKLSSMSTDRGVFSLVHLDGYLYAVGGTGSLGWLDSAERFNMATQVWDRRYTLPDPIIRTSAVAFNGKLLVYGLKDYGKQNKRFFNTYALLAFDPISQNWSKLFEEQIWTRYESPNVHSVIVVHDEACFRVWYEASSSGEVPHVNEIDVRILRNGVVKARISYEVGQAAVPVSHSLGGSAFHINGQVYVNVSQCVHNTGMCIKNKELKLKDLKGWEDCDFGSSGVVEFTLDMSKLTPKNSK